MFYEKTLMKKYPEYYNKKYGYCDYRYEKSFYVPPENDKEDNHNNSSLHIGNNTTFYHPNVRKNVVCFDDIFEEEK